jgi:hypothetical protein
MGDDDDNDDDGNEITIVRNTDGIGFIPLENYFFMEMILAQKR